MSKTVEEICQDLEAFFPEGPPADERIRSQGFDYLTRHWTDRWPVALPIPTALKGPERQHVSRSDLFALANEVSSAESILNLYVAVCAWGTGTKAQRVARVTKPLHEEGALDALQRSLHKARTLDPVKAYHHLNSPSEDRIKGFGPAFFTKWLYFAAYDDPNREGLRAPLIFDDRVSNALGWASTTNRRPFTAYARYLDVAAEVNARWCPTSPRHVVEYALFKLGAN